MGAPKELRDPRDVLDPARMDQVEKALQDLIVGDHTMHVPAQAGDADLVVSQWIVDARLAIRALREGNALAEAERLERARAWRDGGA